MVSTMAFLSATLYRVDSITEHSPKKTHIKTFCEDDFWNHIAVEIEF